MTDNMSKEEVQDVFRILAERMAEYEFPPDIWNNWTKSQQDLAEITIWHFKKRILKKLEEIQAKN